jgi:hypothetical protein
MSGYTPSYVTVLGQNIPVGPDYNSNDPTGTGSIMIDPAGMSDHIDEMARRIDSIVTHVKKAADAFDIPDVGWAGSSKEEATAFSNGWQAAIADLFGKPDEATDGHSVSSHKRDPNPDGAANKLLLGVRIALNNFAWGEDCVKAAWDNYTANLTAPAGPWDGGERNLDDGPVIEHNPRK